MSANRARSSTSDVASTLAAARPPRQPLHPLEKTLVVLVCTQLVFLPWALGGRGVEANIPSFIIALLAFIVALLPRNYDDRSEGQEPFRLYTWPKLVRFPFFWLGLLFLGYVALQGLNPSWIYRSDPRGFWIEKLDYKTWLPTGISAPFDKWNPWRLLMIYSAAWMMVCAVWIGFTRRRAFQLLFNTLMLNGLVMGIFALLQRAAGNGKLLWLFDPPTTYFVVTIPYKNHAASYFNLMLALTVALTVWYFLRGLRRFERSSPSIMMTFGAALLVGAVIVCYSRAGALLTAVFLLVAGIAAIVYNLRYAPEKRSALITVGLLMVFTGFGSVAGYAMGGDKLIAGIERLFKQDRLLSVGNREFARDATLEMARDRLTYGWGAGSFRFAFPQYQNRYPQIRFDAAQGRVVFWEHAHNDLAQSLAEFGLVGCALILAIFAYSVGKLIQSRFWRNPLSFIVATGLALTVVHAWIDFPFQNPTILTTWAALFVAIVAWSRLDDMSPISTE